MKISKNCYVIYGLSTIPPWMVNSGFIVGGNITLVVDCGSNYLSAKTIYGYAKNIKPDNQIIAINTEPHFDHIGGNCFFQEMGVDIYGHDNLNRTNEELEEIKSDYKRAITNKLRRDASEENLFFYNTKVVNPNKTIVSDFILELGGLDVQIVLTPGHTSMNLCVYVPTEKILYSGDTIVTGYIPNMEDGCKEDWKDWLLSLEKIKKFLPEIVVPGHGEILRGNQIEEELIRIKSFIHGALEKREAPTNEEINCM